MITHGAREGVRRAARLAVMASLAGAPAVAAPAVAIGTTGVADIVNRFCVDCHDKDTRKGGLSLEGLDPARAGDAPAIWEPVVQKLRHRQMPPPGRSRPDERAYDAAITTLAAELDRAAADRLRPGRVDTFRRLTRAEYRRAVRDLLLVDVDVADLLPKDEQSRGFDNITVGELSPAALEKYLSAAKKVTALALGRAPRAPTVETISLPVDLTQVDRREGLPPGTRGGAVVTRTLPVDAEYEIQLRLARDRNEKVEGLRRPCQLDLLVDGRPVQRFPVEPPPAGAKHDNVDRHLVARLALTAGPHAIGATFVQESGALAEGERQPTLAHFNNDRHPRPQPALYSITVAGPFDPTGPGDTAARRRLLSCRPRARADEAGCAEAILGAVIRRAYRRPATPADLAAPLRLFAGTSRREGFEAGIEMALRAVLTSPHFLFRIELGPEDAASGAVARVPDLALASRLSFFLWGSLPDDELLDRAARGELADPEVLAREAERLLRDPRADALVDGFAAQWLYLRNLESVRPDARLFMDFDANLRHSMYRETELFFGSILREDRSVLDLLRAEYTYLDERLARHYGIPHVYGSEFRRVSLAAVDSRGGLLTQASLLTVTSQATRTSPVVRGSWILGNLLGTPPKPPPPDVPPLKERSDAGGRALSIREQLAAHRQDRVCATCHDLMDPIGFALENYDAIGRFRTRDGDDAVDASGALPDGARFRGARGLERAILQRPELFVTTLTEKLMTYALGRGLRVEDAPAVRQIVREAARNDYRFSSLILGIVASVPFTMREAP